MMSVAARQPSLPAQTSPLSHSHPAPAEKARDNVSRARPRLSHKTLYKQSLAEFYTSFKMPLGINNPLPSSMRSAYYLRWAVLAMTLLISAQVNAERLGRFWRLSLTHDNHSDQTRSFRLRYLQMRRCVILILEERPTFQFHCIPPKNNPALGS
jgi:hypothetical protein